jgi:hypothetical protein
MANWEEELAVLLQELGVKQEEPQAPLPQARKPARRDMKRRDHHSDTSIFDEGSEIGQEDTEMQDLASMRREVDSIVNQVILLMQRGDLDPSIKEDIIVVLRALRHRLPGNPVSMLSSTNEEAYLESASALLHFCRLVLYLSEFATEGF